MQIDMASDAAIAALDIYIGVLAESAERTRQAEDRSRYRGHLASAAVMLHLVRKGDWVGFKKLVADEQRCYGNAFLSGEDGAAAETAFATFADFVKSL
jgi:hypothetical protein